MDITAGYHQGDSFSRLAHQSIVGDKAKLQAEVLKHIRLLGSATSDDVENMTGLSHQTVSARMTELKALNAIVPAEHKKTRSGRSAQAWRIK